MLRGTIKFFNESKGFGFIKDDASGEDVFVHVSGLIDKVYNGAKVSYETKQGKKGINAINVRLEEDEMM